MNADVASKVRSAEQFLKQIRDELTERTYVPLRSRRQEIPKDGGKVRVLSIPMVISQCTPRSRVLGTMALEVARVTYAIA